MSEKKKALVADDMEVNRNAIKTFLFFSKFDVDLASDGLEAKALYEKASYDLVFSDIEMPNMNGFEFLTWIRKSSARKTTPVIMLSSLDSPEVIERCKRIGATAYIVKPFTKEKMDAALKCVGTL
ncbi:hypothetical protein MASR2M78_11570 [Treponema sp.]